MILHRQGDDKIPNWSASGACFGNYSSPIDLAFNIRLLTGWLPDAGLEELLA